MTSTRILLAASLAATAAALSIPVLAQVGDGNCIVAGRVTPEQIWAPRMAGVELLGQDGTVVTTANRQALAAVRQVRLSQPALLTRCDGSKELTRGDDLPAKAKGPVPAVGPGMLAVEAVSYPKLRSGGALVELKLAVTPERVVMLTR